MLFVPVGSGPSISLNSRKLVLGGLGEGEEEEEEGRV